MQDRPAVAERATSARFGATIRRVVVAGSEQRSRALWQAGILFVVAIERREHESLRVRIEQQVGAADMTAIPFAQPRLRFRLVVVNDCPAIRAAPRHRHRRET